MEYYTGTTKCEGVAYGTMKWETHEVQRSEWNDKWKRLKQARSWRKIEKLRMVNDRPTWVSL